MNGCIRWSASGFLLLASVASSTPNSASDQHGGEARRASPTQRERAPAPDTVRIIQLRANAAALRDRISPVLVAQAPSFGEPETPSYVPVRYALPNREAPVATERDDAEIAFERALGVPEPGVGSALLSTLALVLFAFVRRLKS
jgi:hypothetical protein